MRWIIRSALATKTDWTTSPMDPEAAARTTVKFGNKLEYGHELAMMKASVALIKPDKDPIGASKAAEWEELQKMLVNAEFQKTKVDVSKAFTNAELPQ